MTTANKLNGAIGALTGLAYLMLALVDADGIAWVIPVVVAAVAYAVVGGLTRQGRGGQETDPPVA